MPTSYSPIDEPSFTDTASFDPEEMLNPHRQSNLTDTSAGRDTVDSNPVNAQPAASAIHDDGMGRATSAAATAAAAAALPEDMTGETTATSAPKLQWLNAITSAIGNLKLFKFAGIVLFFFAAYAFVVCCSYFFTIGSDQSAILNGELDLDMYENAGRKFGALLAHTLIYDWVGVGAFILIFYAGACGLSMIGVYRPGFWGMTMRCLLSTVALSVVAGLATFEIASPVYWGGMHGQLLNERLIAYSGFWGALAISLILLSMTVMLYISEIRNGWSAVSGSLDGYREKQAVRRARREALRAEAEAKAEALRATAETTAELERLRAENERLKAEATAKAAAKPTTTESATNTVADMTAATVTPAGDTATIEEESHETARTDAEQESDEIDDKEIETDDETDNDTDDIDSSDHSENSDNTDTAEQDDDTDTVFGSLFSNTAHDDTDDEQLSPLFKDSATTVPGKNNETIDPRDLPPYDPRADLSNFKFPSIDLLRPAKVTGPSIDVMEMEENKKRIIETLRSCGVTISSIEATIGPTVTLYEIIPAEGVRTRSVKSLGDDLQLRLAALGVRIIAPIPAKGTIGIEVPNKDPQVVSMRTVLDSEVYRNCKMELPMALGKTISDDIFMADLAKMPHLLVAGATGMGKSVGLNAIIASLLYKKHPAELKFVLIDPKRVELSLYRKLEHHYLASLPGEDAIITDMTKVVTVLNSLCIEMDNRLKLLEKAGARNIKEYNEKFVSRRLNMNDHRFLPYIVLVIDEFADLIIRQGKEIEEPVSRLAAVARAAGIHLIIATQRPTVNVITGNIKLNIPGRIAFRVIQGNDSRTILDQLGANQLIGKGDMLFSNNGKLERVQCAFIDTPEVSDICDRIYEQVGYPQPYELPEYVPEGNDTASVASLSDRDPLFDECARFIVSSDTASTSSLQRRYNIGYNRAGRIMDQMEASGIVGASQGGKPRQVLVDLMSLERILENK